MKYEIQMGALKAKLDGASSVLVILPKEVSTDKLAAALSLYLSLKQFGKSAVIVSESELKVSQSTLFGIGDIKNQLPESNTGNFVMKLDGVVEGGKVPALVNLDWYPTGNDLNLVFHVAPGKKFEPINISHHYDATAFQLIFFVGALNLADFGSIYTDNIAQLGDATKVNIDNTKNNSQFGEVNIADPETASLSEVVAQILQGLNLPQDADISSNIISGIYEATNNLTVGASSETFMTLGRAMQLGGKASFIKPQPNPNGLDISQFGKQSSVISPQSSDNTTQQTSAPAQLVDQTSNDPVTQPSETSITTDNPEIPTPAPASETAKSQYEVPTGEQVSSGVENANPAPDWLTPKIFKGGMGYK